MLSGVGSIISSPERGEGFEVGSRPVGVEEFDDRLDVSRVGRGELWRKEARARERERDGEERVSTDRAELSSCFGGECWD